METKNNSYVWGGIVLVVIIGLIVWGLNKNDDSEAGVGGNVTNNANTALTPNADDVRAAEAIYARAQAVSLKSRVFENGKYVTVVNYNGDVGGFSPQVVYVSKGESIRFVNKSADAMRIALIVSTTGGGLPAYQTIEQEKSVGKNENYSLSLSQPGVWSFYNLNDTDGPVGVVYVK